MTAIRTTNDEMVFIHHIASYNPISENLVQITMVNGDTHNVAIGLQEFVDLVMQDDGPHPGLAVYFYIITFFLVYLSVILSIHIF